MKKPTPPLVFIIASLLLHLLVGGMAEYWPYRQQPPAYVVYRPGEIDQRPFQRRERTTVQRRRAFIGRVASKPSPREQTLAKLDAEGLLLEQGMVSADSVLVTSDSLRVALGAVVERGRWEEDALQVWRDSLAQPLAAGRNKEDELAIISPFELELIGRVKRESVALVDPLTGRLERAFWYFPAYAEYGRFGVDKYGRNIHSLELRSFRARLAELRTGGPLPLIAEMDDRYQLDAGASPAPDSIHRYGRFSRRDVLSYEQMRAYPVLVLCYIDARSQQDLVRHLLAGGYALVDGRQLHGLEQALKEQATGRVRRSDIWSGHPLMGAYHSLGQYTPSARGVGEPPLRGLEVDGRLVAVSLSETHPSCSRICPFSCDPALFANAAAYGLIQAGNLGKVYSSR